jgi:signal transduction histidine kinase/CheY-like chemotaxis protein
MELVGGSSAGRSRTRWLSAGVLAAALVLGGGMFVLTRHINDGDQQRLLTLQAQDARTTITALVGQIESTMSSVGSVAAATGGDPAAVGRLATADPSLALFSALTVLHRTAGGSVAVAAQRGTPSASLPNLLNASGRELDVALGRGGTGIVGLFGHGQQRRLAIAEGAPLVPGGYVVYAEIPLPEGTILKSGFSGLEYALYDGPSTKGPVLFATTKSLPFTGQQARQLINLDDLNKTLSANASTADLLFVVSPSGSLVGALPNLLPWILGALAIVFGLLTAFVVEATSRRKDQALSLVTDLEDKNAALDRAMAEQVQAEKNRMRLEAELRQAQRLESVGRLAGGVAHDFNNLLAAILTYSEFIAEDLGQEHPLQGDVAEVRKAARRATDLTRQLLVFSRRDLVEASVLDVNDSITDLLNLLQRTLGEDIVLDHVLSLDLPCVLVDPGELEQVLVNLAVNARDAIVGQGTITVATSEQVIDDEAASTHADLHPGRFVCIAVSDTGSGMAPEVVEQIFEPFFTTKAPGLGTGLGLSTVYGIVNRYGGFVGVYSEVGLGSTFKVYLPATDRAAEVEEDSGQKIATTMTGETVLLVEDEDAVRLACRRILERAGFQVVEASDGPQALVALADRPIDLLLTDVIMPGGVTGRDLAERLQAARPGLPVLYMSGYTADVIATRGILEPGVNVVEKPFSSSDLLGKVRELLT